MAAVPHLTIVRAPLPGPWTWVAWNCEAIQMGFEPGRVILHLCFHRWYWRTVQGLGPERPR